VTVQTPARHGEGPAARLSRAAADAGARMSGWPWWLQVSLIFVAARLVSACIFMAAALQQGTNPWFPPAPDYWNFITIWDGRWYQRAADDGYPSVLPVDANGVVKENAWAFYALFPLLGRGLSAMTGLGTLQALTVIAMASGLGAALVIGFELILRAVAGPSGDEATETSFERSAGDGESPVVAPAPDEITSTYAAPAAVDPVSVVAPAAAVDEQTPPAKAAARKPPATKAPATKAPTTKAKTPAKPRAKQPPKSTPPKPPTT